jgi:DNA polymerase-3 subunit gamma/tau
MATLYRKYRPQTFAEIHDQEHIVRTLTNEISSQKIAHSYLFTGPRGVGKTTIARLLAKSLNCKNKKDGEFEPCNECASCKEISESRNIDVIEIDAASHTGVDNVRENIIDNAQFKPTQSKYKIFIIDEVHMLSTSAFNALLKTIEEPPTHIVFILATTETHKLPATIISRCQKFNFKKISRDEMIKKLKKISETEGVDVDKNVIEKIAVQSDGGMRDAESLLGQIFSLDKKKITEEDIEGIIPSSNLNLALDYLFAITDGDVKPAFQHTDTLSIEGINAEQFALDALNMLRMAMISQSGYDLKNAGNFEKEIEKRIISLGQKIQNQKIVRMIDSLIIRKKEIKQSPISNLPLELFAVEFSEEKNDEAREKEQSKIEPVQKQEKKQEDTKPAQIITQRKIAPKSTIEDINAKWGDVIAEIGKKNSSLIFVLKMCKLEKVDEDGLHISFSFSIHRDKINEPKNKQIIAEELEKQIGEKIQIICDVCDEEKKNTEDTAVQNIAAEFGGEVV